MQEVINLIQSGEPIFILRAKDNFSMYLLDMYSNMAKNTNCPEKFIDDLINVAHDFFLWREKNRDKCKNPD